MKNLLMLLVITLLFSCRKENEIEKTRRDPVPHFKAYINGIEFLALAESKLPGLNIYDKTEKRLTIGMINLKNGYTMALEIHNLLSMENLRPPYTIHSSQWSTTDHVALLYYFNNTSIFPYTSSSDPASLKLSVTKLYNDIIEGTFSGYLEGSDTIQITHGRFKIKFKTE